MKRVVTGSIISLVAVGLLASASLAQEASSSAAAPTGAPLPYADYVAALDAFTQDDPFGALSDPPTKEEVVAGFENLVVKATAEQERLQAVVPEACYAEAHQELLAYWASSIEVTAEASSQLAVAASLDQVGPISSAMDEVLFERHPVAYVAVDDGSGGFQGSPFNILSALATCESGAGSASSPALGSPTP